MSMVSSKLRIGAFQGGVAVGSRLLDTVELLECHQYHVPSAAECKCWAARSIESMEDEPITVSFLALVMLRRVFGF